MLVALPALARELDRQPALLQAALLALSADQWVPPRARLPWERYPYRWRSLPQARLPELWRYQPN